MWNASMDFFHDGAKQWVVAVVRRMKFGAPTVREGLVGPLDFAAQETVYFVCCDDPVVDGSEPTRHDDANGSSMIQPGA